MAALADPVFPDRADESFDSSVWKATAIAAPALSPLEGRQSTDVAIVGAGYTGLGAALHLAERGIRVTVLEAREPGWGASGRNGGQVIPMLRHEPDEILRRFGVEAGGDLVRMVARSADDLFELIRRRGMECDAVQTGWIQGAHGRNGGAIVRRRVAAWSGVGARARVLAKDELAALSGSHYYPEGWIHEGSGSVNPLGLARALAIAARDSGATIHVDSMVTRLARSADRWIVGCPGGEVEARTVVLATNGYTTPLWPGLSASIIPLYSLQVATDPLPAAIRATILPGRQTMADTRRLVWYFRCDRDGRFVMGARGPFKAKPGAGDARGLVAAARRLYPGLDGVGFPFVWSGRVAMTPDHLPHLHRLAPGLIAALGYNGRGVAMATAMGRVLAAACVDEQGRRPAFPLSELRTIPFHACHRLGVRAVVAFWRMADRVG